LEVREKASFNKVRAEVTKECETRHWWEFEESENEVLPVKDPLPEPPRPLTKVDKDKYQIRQFMENGQIKQDRREEAYEQYYKVKFERMCEK